MLNLAKRYGIEIHSQYYEGNHIMALNPFENHQLQDYCFYFRKYQDKLVPLVLKMWKIQTRYWQLIKLKQNNKQEPMFYLESCIKEDWI